jgi:hypothetical protein
MAELCVLHAKATARRGQRASRGGGGEAQWWDSRRNSMQHLAEGDTTVCRNHTCQGSSPRAYSMDPGWETALPNAACEPLACPGLQ